MNRLKKVILAFGVSVVAGGTLVAVSAPGVVYAAAITSSSSASDCSQNFLTFPTWFRGLVKVEQTTPGIYECVVESPSDAGGLSPFIWHIVLNIIEMGLQAVVYLTAGFILWGGFQFLVSQGSPDVAAKGRQTIMNAAIGMGISIAAIAAVNLISAILIHKP